MLIAAPRGQHLKFLVSGINLVRMPVRRRDRASDPVMRVARRRGWCVPCRAVLAAARQVIDCPHHVVRARAPGQRAPQSNDC
jgi:hypothetical protein